MLVGNRENNIRKMFAFIGYFLPITPLCVDQLRQPAASCRACEALPYEYDSRYGDNPPPGRRDTGKIHPLLGPRRAERQQGGYGSPASVRCPPIPVSSRYGSRTSGPVGGKANDRRRRPDHRSPPVSDPGAQPGGCQGTLGRVDPQGCRARQAPPGNPAHEKIKGTQAGVQASTKQGQTVPEGCPVFRDLISENQEERWSRLIVPKHTGTRFAPG